MKIQLRILRKIIREEISRSKKYQFGGSYPEEDYEVELLHDPDYESPSVYVPNDVKKKINKWAEHMGLKSKK
jgi:hypothetical protein